MPAQTANILVRVAGEVAAWGVEELRSLDLWSWRRSGLAFGTRAYLASQYTIARVSCLAFGPTPRVKVGDPRKQALVRYHGLPVADLERLIPVLVLITPLVGVGDGGPLAGPVCLLRLARCRLTEVRCG